MFSLCYDRLNKEAIHSYIQERGLAAMEGIRATDIRESNEKLVKRFLMEYGECTKMDIANGSGLSHPTVAKVLAEMVETGQAVKVGKETSYGGRCSDKYRLDYDYHHVLILIFTTDSLYYQVNNLAQKKKESGTIPIQGETHILEAADLISDVRTRFPNIRLVEIGLPGNILDGRLVYMATPFYLVGCNVVEELEKRCHLPIQICNDVNAMAYGFYKRHIEVSLKQESMAYLFRNHSGPGAGIIINGKIINGFSGFAGEVCNVWPPQNNLMDEVKSQIAAILSVINPRYLVLSHDRTIELDTNALRRFVEELFPRHTIPQFHITQEIPAGSTPELHFTTEFEENCADGLVELAIESIFP